MLGILFLAATVAVNAQQAEKKIEKSYNINKGFTLGIDNAYGEINFVNWDRNEVSVAVTITVEAKSESKAEDLLKKINVDISESKSEVLFDTELENIVKMGKTEIKVVYDVKSPAYINANLEQSYGNIYVQEIAGLANIEVKYGGLTADALSFTGADWNVVELAYSDATIGFTNAMQAEVKYGRLEIDEAGKLIVESAYSELKYGSVKELEAESKYDKISIKSLVTSLDLESAYTHVMVGQIEAGFSEITAEMSYGNFKSKLAPGAAFEISADVAYGSIVLPEGNYVHEKDGARQEAEGTVGNNPKAVVSADIRYGNLVIN